MSQFGGKVGVFERQRKSPPRGQAKTMVNWCLSSMVVIGTFVVPLVSSVHDDVGM